MGGRPVAAFGLAAIALVIAGLAWWEDVPALTAADAVTAAEHGFAGAGLDAEVGADPFPTTYASNTRDPVDVWSVQATVRSELVHLQLSRVGADPVAIDDRALDGSSYVLSDLEYQALAAHLDDPARDRRVRRNLAVTTAAVAILAVALALAAAAPRKEPR
jgi:hypothetical protein